MRNGGVAAHGGHHAAVPIMESKCRLSGFAPLNVSCCDHTLLESYWGDLAIGFKSLGKRFGPVREGRAASTTALSAV